MVYYESIPQFTNQLAYQSVFAPPGFSFESPFAYPMISQPMQSMPSGSGGGTEDHKSQLAPVSGSGSTGSMPMSRPPPNHMGMDMDPMSSASVNGSGQEYTGGNGLSQGLGSGPGMGLQVGMNGMIDPWKSAWPVAEGGDKLASPSLQ